MNPRRSFSLPISLAGSLLASVVYGAGPAVCNGNALLDREKLRSQYQLPSLSQLAVKAGIGSEDKIVDVKARCKDSVPVYELFYLDQSGVIHRKDLYFKSPTQRISQRRGGKGRHGGRR